MFHSRILAAAAAVAAIAPAAYAAAPVSDDSVLTRQVHVRADDLNLASAAGQRALQSRVRAATAQVCDASRTGQTFKSADVRRCKQAALTDASHQVANVMAFRSTQFAQATPAQAPTNTASGS